MRQLLNTLYVTTHPAYLRLEGDTLCVEVEREKKLQVPLHHLGALVLFGDVLVSPALLRRCATDQRSVVLLDRNGRFSARLEGPVSGNVLLRRAHFLASEHAGQNLELARSFVAGKIRNSRHVLLRGARDSRDDADRNALREAARHLARNLAGLRGAASTDSVRGLEGDAARVYFGVLRHLIRVDRRVLFAYEGRNRRPPLDRINALLSFLYSLVLHDCVSAVEGVGLDPQIGFLHTLRPGRPALGLDLLEEFRAVIADRLALTLINRGQLGEADFETRTGGAVYLTEQGRRTVLTNYQLRKQDELTHPLLDQSVPVGLLPHVQARLLARALRGDMEGYLPFLMR